MERRGEVGRPGSVVEQPRRNGAERLAIVERFVESRHPVERMGRIGGNAFQVHATVEGIFHRREPRLSPLKHLYHIALLTGRFQCRHLAAHLHVVTAGRSVDVRRIRRRDGLDRTVAPVDLGIDLAGDHRRGRRIVRRNLELPAQIFVVDAHLGDRHFQRRRILADAGRQADVLRPPLFAVVGVDRDGQDVVLARDGEPLRIGRMVPLEVRRYGDRLRAAPIVERQSLRQRPDEGPAVLLDDDRLADAPIAVARRQFHFDLPRLRRSILVGRKDQLVLLALDQHPVARLGELPILIVAGDFGRSAQQRSAGRNQHPIGRRHDFGRSGRVLHDLHRPRPRAGPFARRHDHLGGGFRRLLVPLGAERQRTVVFVLLHCEPRLVVVGVAPCLGIGLDGEYDLAAGRLEAQRSPPLLYRIERVVRRHAERRSLRCDGIGVEHDRIALASRQQQNAARQTTYNMI